MALPITPAYNASMLKTLDSGLTSDSSAASPANSTSQFTSSKDATASHIEIAQTATNKLFASGRTVSELLKIRAEREQEWMDQQERMMLNMPAQVQALSVQSDKVIRESRERQKEYEEIKEKLQEISKQREEAKVHVKLIL